MIRWLLIPCLLHTFAGPSVADDALRQSLAGPLGHLSRSLGTKVSFEVVTDGLGSPASGEGLGLLWLPQARVARVRWDSALSPRVDELTVRLLWEEGVKRRLGEGQTPPQALAGSLWEMHHRLQELAPLTDVGTAAPRMQWSALQNEGTPWAPIVLGTVVAFLWDSFRRYRQLLRLLSVYRLFGLRQGRGEVGVWDQPGALLAMTEGFAVLGVMVFLKLFPVAVVGAGPAAWVMGVGVGLLAGLFGTGLAWLPVALLLFLGVARRAAEERDPAKLKDLAELLKETRPGSRAPSVDKSTSAPPVK